MIYLHDTNGQVYVVNTNLVTVAVRRGDVTHLEFTNGNFLNVTEQLSDIFKQENIYVSGL